MRQSLLVDRTAISANLVVLTEETLHVAAGEKDVTDSVFAAYDRLFSAVKTYRTDTVVHPTLTVVKLSCASVSVTFARTESAVAQFSKKPFDSMACHYEQDTGKNWVFSSW